MVAAQVLRQVRTELTRAHVVWATLRYRDERKIWLPYWPWWLLGGKAGTTLGRAMALVDGNRQ